MGQAHPVTSANGFSSAHSRRVSFILATKNRASHLEKALKLASELKKADDELIIVDGLSSDETLEVVRRHEGIVDVLISEPDLSEGHAFNKGILVSRGRYVKLLTDDDVIYPEAMEQAIGVMEDNPRVELLLCGGTKERAGRWHTVYLPPGVNYGRQVADVFRYGGCGIGLLIRRSSFARVGLLNPKAVALDLDFLAQAIAGGATVRFCRIKLYQHVIEDHSGIVRRRREWEQDRQRILQQYGLLAAFRRPRAPKGAQRVASLARATLRQHSPAVVVSAYRRIRGRKQAVGEQGRELLQQHQERGCSDEGLVWDAGLS
ncbi:MAG: glycosyltransferase [Acidobacteria bacterium]|nr:glycosyltransferase [Acidobacteriota bacterium]